LDEIAVECHCFKNVAFMTHYLLWKMAWTHPIFYYFLGAAAMAA
jgi:hypothetical protein